MLEWQFQSYKSEWLRYFIVMKNIFKNNKEYHELSATQLKFWIYYISHKKHKVVYFHKNYIFLISYNISVIEVKEKEMIEILYNISIKFWKQSY